MEKEMHAAKRVADAISDLSLPSRARVLKLVTDHTVEEADRVARAELEEMRAKIVADGNDPARWGLARAQPANGVDLAFKS